MNEVRKEVESEWSMKQQQENSASGEPYRNLSVNVSQVVDQGVAGSLGDLPVSPPSNFVRTPSMTSMFSSSSSQIGQTQELLYGAAERFRSDSIGSGGGQGEEDKGNNSKKNRQPPSLLIETAALASVSKSLPNYYHQPHSKHFMNNIMESIQEVLGEFDDSSKSINEQASLHIHNNQTILTYCSSKTILSFLISAHQKYRRRFNVIVAEGAPHNGGHVMATKLSAAGIPVTLINDAAISAMMSRVDCFLLSAHAVLANGGLIAPSGSHLCALAAKANQVSTIVVTGLGFKLSPLYPHEGQDTFQDLISPSVLLPNNAGGTVDFQNDEMIDLISPVHDYISPDLVSLFVTNIGIGGFQPSYVYRLLVELYNPDDPVVFE